MTSKIQSEKIVGKMYESQNQSKPRRDFKKPGSEDTGMDWEACKSVPVFQSSSWEPDINWS